MTIGADDLAGPDQLVEGEPGPGPLAVAEPADPGGQALERHARLGHLDPAAQPGVVREELEDRPVGPEDVGRVAGQRDPPERPAALAELRPDERRARSPGSRRRPRRPPPAATARRLLP